MSRDDTIPAARPCQVLRRLFSQDTTMREIIISNYSNSCTHVDAKNDIVVMLDALCMFPNNVDTLKLAEDVFPESFWHALINVLSSSTSLVRLEVACHAAIPSFVVEMFAHQFKCEITHGSYNRISISITRFNALSSTRLPSDDAQLVIEMTTVQ